MKKKAMILLDKEKHIMTLLADCQMNKWRYCVVVFFLMWNQKGWPSQAKTRGIRAFCLKHINNSFSILSRPIFSYRNSEENSAVLSPSLTNHPELQHEATARAIYTGGRVNFEPQETGSVIWMLKSLLTLLLICRHHSGFIQCSSAQQFYE